VTGQEIEVISGFFDAVRHAAWNPEGDRFVLTSWGGTVRTFFTPLAGTLEEACSRTVRNLSQEEWDKLIPETSCRATCPNLPDLCISGLQVVFSGKIGIEEFHMKRSKFCNNTD